MMFPGICHVIQLVTFHVVFPTKCHMVRMDYREEFCNVAIAFPEPVVKNVTDEKLSLETVLSNM